MNEEDLPKVKELPIHPRFNLSRIRIGILASILSVFLLIGFLFSAGIHDKLKTKIIPTPTSVTNGSDTFTAAQYHQADASLADIVIQKDPTVALTQLRNLTNVDPALEHYCHGLAHDIGHVAYKKYGFSGALMYLSDVCGSGYIHGIIEEYFTNTKDLEEALHTVCVTGVAANQKDNCYHGIGHGLMFYLNNNVPLSLVNCSSFTDTIAKVRCSEGVFMENFNSDTRFHTSNYLDKNNPFYPCPQQITLYKDACYFYATDYYLILHPNQYANAIQWCNTAEKDFILTCDRGVGSRMLKYNSGDPKQVEKMCMTAKNDAQVSGCIDGMLSYFLVQYNSLSRARTLCQSLEVKNQTSCYQAISARQTMFLE